MAHAAYCYCSSEFKVAPAEWTSSITGTSVDDERPEGASGPIRTPSFLHTRIDRKYWQQHLHWRSMPF